MFLNKVKSLLAVSISTATLNCCIGLNNKSVGVPLLLTNIPALYFNPKIYPTMFANFLTSKILSVRPASRNIRLCLTPFAPMAELAVCFNSTALIVQGVGRGVLSNFKTYLKITLTIYIPLVFLFAILIFPRWKSAPLIILPTFYLNLFVPLLLLPKVTNSSLLIFPPFKLASSLGLLMKNKRICKRQRYLLRVSVRDV